MLFFSGSSNNPLAEKIASECGSHLQQIELTTFPDGEKRVKVPDTVVGHHCVVVESTSPPVDIHCMELFFIIDALKRTGAESVTAVIPYFGYERQDHVFRPGEARSLEVIVRTLEMLKTDGVISVDLHSVKIPEIFTIPMHHLSALSVFAETIKENGWYGSDTVLVTPDMGGIRRIEELSHMLDDMPYLSVEKDRDLESGSIQSNSFHGHVKKRAIMVDDIAASGKTLVAATDLLLQNGAEEVYAFVTHPVFSPEAPDLLQNSNISKVYVTDSIVVAEDKQFEKLQVLSIAKLISKAL